jgi:hypothetical protein
MTTLDMQDKSSYCTEKNWITMGSIARARDAMATRTGARATRVLAARENSTRALDASKENSTR